MPTLLTDYTDNISIRAFLGVSDLEIENELLALPANALVIESGLDALNPAVAPLYTTIKAIASGSRSVQQARFYEQVRMYAGLLVADAVMPILPMAAPKKIEDSKAALERVNDPYTKLAESIRTTLATLAGRILVSLDILEPGSLPSKVARNYAVAIDLAINPVTRAAT